MSSFGKTPFISMLSLAMLYTQSAMAEAPQIDIPRINSSKISIDADLSEPVWQQAKQVDMNNITFPEENQTAKVKTKAYLFEDGDTLYVGFIAEDPNPEKIRAYLRDRDSNNIWNDDLIGIKLDTYGDHKLAYQFWINAYGVQVDSIENVVTGNESTAWDAIWDSSGRITDKGYVVEIALPLRILNFNDQLDKQNWNVELVRFYPRETRQRISNMTIDPNNNCLVCQMGPLSGFAGAKQGKNIAVVPSLTLGTNQVRDVDATSTSDWHSDSDSDIGLDIKWGITPDISLNATLNPDFSQIEADVAQLSINNTFSLFFPEKRAFFLDNADYFATPLQLVYTRNISDPDYGARLTGRVKEHSFGLFVANDTATTLFVPGNLGSTVAVLDEESTNTAMRYRYDPSKNLSIGLSGTFRTNDEYHNYVGALDIKYKVTESDDLSAQILHSETEYPQDLYKRFLDEEANAACDEVINCQYNERVLRTKKDGEFSDQAYVLRYSHNERDWNFSTSYAGYGEDFRADLGFTPIIDWNKFVIGGNRIWRGDQNDWWKRIRVGGDWDTTHDDKGDLLEKESQIWVQVEGSSLTYTGFTITDRDRVGTRERDYELSVTGNAPLFHETQVDMYYNTQLMPNLETSINLGFGDEIDFANNRLGKVTFIRPSFVYNPNKHLTIKSTYTHKNIDADGAEVFTARLLDTRFTYQFSVRSFVRLALIYSDIDRNPDNYLFKSVDRNRRSLATQLLYSYKINPQTLFFLGYSDNAFSNDVVDDMTRDNRTVFMKFSYAWLQ